MSRPIFEPSLTRTDRKLGFSADQLFRRPAPTTSGGLELVHLFAWNYDTVNTVANTTWTDICGLGGSDGFFEEVFYTPAFSTSWDCTSGNVNLGTSGEYLLQGWVQFNEDAVAGEQRFVAINFGSGNRHIQEFVAVAASTALLANKLPVHTFYLRTGTTNCHIDVWHNHGSDISVRDAEFSVKRLVLYTDGTDENC